MTECATLQLDRHQTEALLIAVHDQQRILREEPTSTDPWEYTALGEVETQLVNLRTKLGGK